MLTFFEQGFIDYHNYGNGSCGTEWILRQSIRKEGGENGNFFPGSIGRLFGQ